MTGSTTGVLKGMMGDQREVKRSIQKKGVTGHSPGRRHPFKRDVVNKGKKKRERVEEGKTLRKENRRSGAGREGNMLHQAQHVDVVDCLLKLIKAGVKKGGIFF